MLDPLRKADPAWYYDEWFYDLVKPRLSDVAVSLDEVRRPTVPTGYVLKCTVAGRTGNTEPGYPAVGGTVMDGSVQWTVVAVSSVTVPLVSTISYAVTPAGVTIETEEALPAIAQTRAYLDASAATPGTYELVATMNDDSGEEHVHREYFVVVE